MRILILILFLVFSLAYSVLALTTTIDPLDIGVGTRPLGMGKAFIAAADDINSIFLNPAGLSYAHNWGLTSVYSSLFSEVAYLTLGAYRATDREGWGVGYVGANIAGDIYVTYRDPVTRRIVPIDTFAAGYSSSVLLLSYGLGMGKYYDFPYADKLSLGLSLKLFYQQLKSTEETYATGQDLDIGLVYKENEWLKFGFYGQNVLPPSTGGSLIWNSGAREDIPANYKLGVSFKAFGENARWDYPQDIYFNLDLEDSFTAGRSTIYHTGVEWWVYKYLALRFGLDQDVYAKGAGNGIDNNLTFGLGFWSGDYGFDYSYHQYGPYTENISHYFSLSYGYPLPVTAPAPLPAPSAQKPVAEQKMEPVGREYIRISELSDKSFVYSKSIYFNGKIMDSEVSRVLINGNEAAILRQSGKENPVFSLNVPVPQLGKFTLTIKCLNQGGNLLKEYKLRIIRLASFSDIGADSLAKDTIQALATLSILGGFPDTTFRPNKTINRAELTAILVRATGMAVPEVNEDLFTDIGRKYWAAGYIKVGIDRGIVQGYRDKTFKPTKTLNRAEALIMIGRFAGLRPPETVSESPFPDVPASHWAASMIFAAKQEGLLDFLAGKPFEPNRLLTRAEAAEMISKTKYGKEKIRDLYNWDIGFE